VCACVGECGVMSLQANMCVCAQCKTNAETERHVTKRRGMSSFTVVTKVMSDSVVLL
jgi:hypothetical protein